MDSWTISKGILYILARGILLFGAVVMGLTGGALAFAIYKTSGSNLAPLVGLIGGVTGYCAGIAGRHHVSALYLSKLLPPPPPKP